jgi:hypothetical protein
MSNTNTASYFLYDFATGETITRELTAEEIAELPQGEPDDLAG